jgi:hypothetical protein
MKATSNVMTHPDLEETISRGKKGKKIKSMEKWNGGILDI